MSHNLTLCLATTSWRETLWTVYLTQRTLEGSVNMSIMVNGGNSAMTHSVRTCTTMTMRRTTGNLTTTTPTALWYCTVVTYISLYHFRNAWTKTFWHSFKPVSGWSHIRGLSGVLWQCGEHAEGEERNEFFQRWCLSWDLLRGSGAEWKSGIWVSPELNAV